MFITEVSLEKLHLSWIVSIFLRKKYVQNKHKGNKTKTKPVKPKLLKTFHLNEFQASWSSDFICKDLKLEL